VDRAGGDEDEEDEMVQLGRIKGIKGRLVTRIFRFPRLVLHAERRGDQREKKGRRKVRSLPAAI
jgi:hypothetical protein